MVVDPSEKEILVRELEDVGEGLPREAEHDQPVAVDGLPMMMMVMVMMITMGLLKGTMVIMMITLTN